MASTSTAVLDSDNDYADYNHYDWEDSDPNCCHCESSSIRSASPAPSLYSFSSSRDGHVLKDLWGRTLNSLCDVSALPALFGSQD
jgi:hypothetical protein